MPETLIFREECYRIIGACFEVYNDKGSGFLEPVYQECLEIELELQAIPSVPHQAVHVSYRGRELKQKFIPDFVCYGNIIVEIKAVSSLIDEHRAQVINYLNASGFYLGILVNFGAYPKLDWERLVHTAKRPYH